MKIIAIDLDGTLLNSDHSVSEENLQAVRSAKEKGGNIILASGRSPKSVQGIADELNLQGSIMICLNGSLVMESNSNEILFCSQIELDISRRIIEFVDNKDLLVIFSFLSGNYAYSPMLDLCNVDLVQEFQNSKKYINIVDKQQLLKEIEEDEVMKVALTTDDSDELNQMYKLLTTAGLAPIYSDKNYIEVLPTGTNKGSALAWVVDYLGLDRKDVMALGDQENDVEMIEYARIGIAMGNAISKLKEIADHTTASNDDSGVAKAINKYMFDGIFFKE